MQRLLLRHHPPITLIRSDQYLARASSLPLPHTAAALESTNAQRTTVQSLHALRLCPPSRHTRWRLLSTMLTYIQSLPMFIFSTGQRVSGRCECINTLLHRMFVLTRLQWDTPRLSSFPGRSIGCSKEPEIRRKDDWCHDYCIPQP